MTASSADDDLIAEMLPAFIEEANEQCATLEQLLLELEANPDDHQLLNALFRCAHTIKGSAGVFGLTRIVGFTHHVEALLQKLRAGDLALTPALGTLLLQSNDMMRSLVRDAEQGRSEGPEDDAAREDLINQLRQATSGETAALAQEQRTSEPAQSPEAALTRRWQIDVRFTPETFLHGLDPMSILHYVASLGDVVDIRCDEQAVPALDELHPEHCHLAFHFGLDTKASRQDIDKAFLFARDDCELHIIEPADSVGHVVARIEAMPDHDRLGDILLSAGAISAAQLKAGLRAQATHEDEAGDAPKLGEVLQSSSAVSPTVVAAALQKQQRQRAGSGEDSNYIRVQADRLDEVITLLGELVIAGAGASMLARQTRNPALVEANQQVSRLIEGIRNSSLKLRMVPIGDTFARFRRVVRDTAKELGKDVQLDIVGGETELDKAMVERIVDPLMHLVRNALDHGLETPAQRLAAGKPEQGKLTLSASHESGSILIRIVDDGRGINREKVLQRAWDHKLIEPGLRPPDHEIVDLIFAPGFSTAEKVTNLSGRGVGMDVVRSNVEAMRGTVHIVSEEGHGATIEIRLPLTLAIIDGFLVGVGASRFILPLDSVVEVISDRVAATQVDPSGRYCVELRGEVLPVVNLRTLYALDSPQPERGSVVVVRHGTRRFGVLVDTLLGHHQTVIKPLGLMLRSLRGVSGSSILGTGEVALIFDTTALGQLAMVPRKVVNPPARAESQGSPAAHLQI